MVGSVEAERRTDKDVLLEVRNLKMYFPVTSGVVFQRKVADVKAVDDLSLTVAPGQRRGHTP